MTDPERRPSPETASLSGFVCFLSTHKKWWLTPILAALVWLAALLAIQERAVGTFEYRMF